MDTDNISLQDLKRQRPDLYQTIKHEICLGELRLTKDDIVSLIEPLSENIKKPNASYKLCTKQSHLIQSSCLKTEFNNPFQN